MTNTCRSLQCYRARGADGACCGYCYLDPAGTFSSRCAGASVGPIAFGGEIVTHSDYCYVCYLHAFYMYVNFLDLGKMGFNQTVAIIFDFNLNLLKFQSQNVYAEYLNTNWVTRIS